MKCCFRRDFFVKAIQRKRMNAKFLFSSDVRLLNKIIWALFRRIC